jgi:hypothetical protein
MVAPSEQGPSGACAAAVGGASHATVRVCLQPPPLKAPTPLGFGAFLYGQIEVPSSIPNSTQRPAIHGGNVNRPPYPTSFSAGLWGVFEMFRIGFLHGHHWDIAPRLQAFPPSHGDPSELPAGFESRMDRSCSRFKRATGECCYSALSTPNAGAKELLVPFGLSRMD